jgi:spore coat protein U-like protein
MTWRVLVRPNRSGLLGALAAAVLLAAAGGATAGTKTTSLLVSVVVEPACTVSAYPLSFGSYTPGFEGVSGNTTLSVRCTRGAPFTVALDAGSGWQRGAAADDVRRLSSANQNLAPGLYTDIIRVTVTY